MFVSKGRYSKLYLLMVTISVLFSVPAYDIIEFKLVIESAQN